MNEELMNKMISLFEGIDFEETRDAGKSSYYADISFGPQHKIRVEMASKSFSALNDRSLLEELTKSDEHISASLIND